MRKFFSLFIVFLFCCCNYSRLENDILKIKTLQEKAKTNVNDSTLLYLRQSQILIDNNPSIPDTLRIENIFRKGYYFKQINQLDSAAYYFHRTVDIIEKPNTRKRNRVYFQNTWETDEAINNLTNGISAAQKFIEISNSKDNMDDIVFAYNALERIHLQLRNYDKSLFYNRKASDAALEASNIDMYVVTAISKAQILDYFGKTEEAFKLLDSLKTIDTDIEVKRQLNRSYGILNYYQGEYKKAIKDYNSVLELSKGIKTEQNYYLLESYTNITEAYIELEDYPIAKKYLDSSKAIITPNSYQNYINFYYQLQFRYNYRTKKNEKELLEEFDTLVKENQKQHEKKINEELTALKLSDEKERLAILQKNEAEIRNVKLIALSGALGLLMLIGYLFYRQRRFKFERQNLQMQQRLLRSQMNPHFIFNTLSAIQNQIQGNREGASNYLLKFSRLLRLILENSVNNYVQIENELDSLRKYLDLQLIRFPNTFNYNITLEQFEEDELLFIPPMLIQPFVENSIEHGFSGIDYIGNIDIKLELKEKWISCSIKDNGVGLKQSNSNLKNSVSINLISKFIRKVTKQKISFTDIKDKNSGKSGVIVEFLIPYKFSEHD